MPDDDQPSIQDLEGRQREAERAAESILASDADGVELIRRERSTIRSHATKVVVWLYALVIAVVVLFIIASAFVTGNYDRAISEIIDLLKTAVIPIVTFVIGHYFGSSGR